MFLSVSKDGSKKFVDRYIHLCYDGYYIICSIRTSATEYMAAQEAARRQAGARRRAQVLAHSLPSHGALH